MNSPFDVLGIDADADDEEIVAAYRQRVKEAHPDVGGSAREFQRVKAAYERIQAGYGTEEYEGEWEKVEEVQTPKYPQVEYLNYEVLDDYGWEIDDQNLFRKAAAAGLDSEDYGQFPVEPQESLLEAAENRGFDWPFACRGGACANCAVAVVAGETEMFSNHVLSSEMTDRGFRLSCICEPATDDMQVVYNVKHLPGLDELRLPPQQFGQASSDD
ncbi:ferredoxin Fer [Haladaptatus caseinilyticus]|uniref:ferredoxin Fer n=1 Tax=Haladaptatus caseinilyticus TaxID=2993314 RepID=UPI0026E54504|nr:ferredoxin Fer [Haladaptatus caseinilyticus]